MNFIIPALMILSGSVLVSGEVAIAEVVGVGLLIVGSMLVTAMAYEREKQTR